MKANKGVSNEKIKIIPLGGLEHIGMNITCIEYEDSIIVIDCGLSFPDEDMLGVDLVIPDVTYLKDNIEKVKGFVITHGHDRRIALCSSECECTCLCDKADNGYYRTQVKRT